jgi:hypothetical protein
MEDFIESNDDFDPYAGDYEPHPLRNALIAAGAAVGLCLALTYAPVLSVVFMAGAVLGWWLQ